MLKNYLLPTKKFLIPFCCIIFCFSACSEDNSDFPMEGLTIQDELNIASRIHDIILADEYYPVLDREIYTSTYDYLDEKINTLTNCELVEHRSNYDWMIHILDNETGTNAFAIPGGYIYFDKGLLKKIDSEASFMNLLANEIAYADKGFVRAKLEARYGLSILIDLALGSMIGNESELLGILYGTPYDVEVVEQADAYMLQLACDKNYDAAYLKDFFIDQSCSITWLDTHPTDSLDKRVNNISQFDCVNDSTSISGNDPYIDFKNTF